MTDGNSSRSVAVIAASSRGCFQTPGTMTAGLKMRQMKTSPMRVSANSSSQRARARAAGPAGNSGGAVSERHLVVDVHRDATQRADAGEFVVALERDDGIGAPAHALDVGDRHHFSRVGGDRPSDDRGGMHRSRLTLVIWWILGRRQ